MQNWANKQGTESKGEILWSLPDRPTCLKVHHPSCSFHLTNMTLGHCPGCWMETKGSSVRDRALPSLWKANRKSLQSFQMMSCRNHAIEVLFLLPEDVKLTHFLQNCYKASLFCVGSGGGRCTFLWQFLNPQLWVPGPLFQWWNCPTPLLLSYRFLVTKYLIFVI